MKWDAFELHAVKAMEKTRTTLDSSEEDESSEHTDEENAKRKAEREARLAMRREQKESKLVFFTRFECSFRKHQKTQRSKMRSEKCSCNDDF